MERQSLKKVAKISAPGKVIICGEHAVVYGENALAMAIDLRCTAIVSACSSQEGSQALVVNCHEGSQTKSYSLQTKQESKSIVFQQCLAGKCRNKQWLNKLNFKIQLFLQHSQLSLPPSQVFVLDIHSDVPMGKCLGSSASFNTVFAACLFLIAGMSAEEIMAHLDQINEMSKRFESVQHGTPSGIDNYLSTFGGLVVYNNSKVPAFQRITSPEIQRKLKTEIDIILADSGQQKDTKKAVEIVRSRYQSDIKYRLMIQQIGTFCARILDLLKTTDLSIEGNWKIEFLDILRKNHQALKQLGVSSPQIETLYNELDLAEKRAVKVTGAGMGGYVLVVSDPQAPPIPSNISILRANIDVVGLKVQMITA